MGSAKTEITQLLKKLDKNESDEIYNQLFKKVYDALKDMAYAHLNLEYGEHTYTRTSLVHEVYLKMIRQNQVNATDRSHFYAIAARCMREILIDYARKKKADKRWGDKHRITYLDEVIKTEKKNQELLDIDHKLKQLAKLNQRLSDVVELRFFGGMSLEDTAQALEISTSTVKRDWKKARGWLYKELK